MKTAKERAEEYYKLIFNNYDSIQDLEKEFEAYAEERTKDMFTKQNMLDFATYNHSEEKFQDLTSGFLYENASPEVIKARMYACRDLDLENFMKREKQTKN